MLRRHWAEILVIGAVFAVLLMDVAPDYTWANTDSDGIHYVYSAQFFVPSHKTSAPLFLLLSHLFLYIPFGTEAWRVSLLSAVASTVAAVFVCLSVRQLTSKKTLALLSVILYGGSALVISQSTIVETYALVTMFSVSAYYFSLKKRWGLCAVMLGLGLAVHTLTLVVAGMIALFNKDFRCWEYAGIIVAFLLFYLYIPITTALNHPPDMWGNTTVKSFVWDNISTTMMLLGGLSIWDFPKRVLDTLGLLGVSLGLALLPIAIMARQWKSLLFWLFLLPILFFATNLAFQTYVYLMPSIAFGSILACVGLNKLNRKWLYATGFVAIVLFAFNANYFDLGRTLDKNLSAAKFYREELPKVPDGAILMPQYGWEWAAIYPFNKRENRNITAVAIDTLVSPIYQEYLKENGIKFEDNFDRDTNTRQVFIATSVVNLNEKVWTTETIDAATYGARVVLAKDNMASVAKMPTEPPAQWHWRPSNPYGFITGAIEITEWKFITWSNKNMLVVASFAVYGYGAAFFLNRLLRRRKTCAG